MIRIAIAAALCALVTVQPARADEIEQALEAALEAYRAGDFATAEQEVEFASGLIRQRKAANLAAFLPEPFEGWGAEEGDTTGTGMAALFGGGLVAQRTYLGPSGAVEVTVMADNPMVASMAAMFSNPSLMATGGQLKRIAGQRAVLSADGELTAMVANRFLVQITGDGEAADKEAYFAAIDFEGLEDF